MVYAPADKGEARDYGVARYGMEVQRLLSVLDSHLEGRQFMVGNFYTIADMACFPWVQTLRGKGYDRPGQPRTVDFLGVAKYTNVLRWADMIMERPATYRGAHQNCLSGPSDCLLPIGICAGMCVGYAGDVQQECVSAAARQSRGVTTTDCRRRSCDRLSTDGLVFI
jgi:hypothetical protein